MSQMEDLEQTVGDLTSRSTHNAARIEQMNAYVETLGACCRLHPAAWLSRCTAARSGSGFTKTSRVSAHALLHASSQHRPTSTRCSLHPSHFVDKAGHKRCTHPRCAGPPAASSQEVLLRRMASLQQQLQEREDEADTLHGALAYLVRPPLPAGPPISTSERSGNQLLHQRTVD